MVQTSPVRWDTGLEPKSTGMKYKKSEHYSVRILMSDLCYFFMAGETGLVLLVQKSCHRQLFTFFISP